MRLLLLCVFLSGCGINLNPIGEPYSYCFEGYKYVQHRFNATQAMDENALPVKCE